MGGILRKIKIGIEGRRISAITTTDCSINTGCIMDCDPLVFCFYLIGSDLNYIRRIWGLRFLEKVRLADFNFQGYEIVGVYCRMVNMENWALYNKMEGQHQDVHPAREEGEITMNEDADATLPSAEFQMELAKTQAEGSEVVVEAMEEEKNLLAVQGLMEKHDEPFDDIEMEIEAINAAMMASGVDLEAEEEFQTLSEEEFEQDSEAQIEKVLLQNAEEPVAGDAHINKELGTGEVATRQGHRKRLFKPNNSTAGSTKMRMASALLSPRKKTAAAAAKVGTRHGDNTKPPESKGPSIPKPVNLKF
ncbi:hypothetical protein HID58_055311 [Brassica napus]|uniref:Uncharacterized protein n=2 Tax=Brassica napus TaxID=3708 RepID=A0ABQ8AKW0_BRANA|nr:hypothetical protein HID58_055311 [Brassica napus]